MTQTAVEWLVNEITNRIVKRNPHDTIIIQTQGEILIELIEQAKEMERQQIMSAFTQGDIFGEDYYDGINITEENYYNQTFKSE